MRKLLLLLLVLFVYPAGTVYSDIFVISNKGVTDTKLSQDDIQDIFLGKKALWSDDTKIVFVTTDDPELHKAFLSTYIKKSPKQYKAYWRKMVFTGQGIPPKTFKTTKELVEFVAKTPGAVGYVDENTTMVNANVININK